MADQSAEEVQEPQAAAEATDLDALDDIEELDDIDFALEEVESKIAPLALAHR